MARGFLFVVRLADYLPGLPVVVRWIVNLIFRQAPRPAGHASEGYASNIGFSDCRLAADQAFRNRRRGRLKLGGRVLVSWHGRPDL